MAEMAVLVWRKPCKKVLPINVLQYYFVPPIKNKIQYAEHLRKRVGSRG
jgi:hypothetical protein